jgi:hypothetical protein
VRKRAVAVTAWGIERWPRVRAYGVRAVSFAGGVLILHREIYEVPHPEPLLIFLGMWLCGVAPAQFFDGLKKMGQDARSGVEELADDTPQADSPKLKSGEQG